MDLILWRHADAQDGYPDSARALTSRGREEAEKVGDWLARRLPPDAVILASPAVRAQQTAEFIGRPFEAEPLVGVNASVRDVLTAAKWSDESRTVVVVGHQPTMGRLACVILTDEAGDWPFEKAAAWWFSRTKHGVLLRAAITPELV